MLRNLLRISERFSFVTNELHLHHTKNEADLTDELLEKLVAAFNNLSEKQA
jgi:hypothetical protein